MPVKCIEDGRKLRAEVAGELDHHGAKTVMEELDRQIDMVLPTQLVIDLEGLTFTDSSGIAVLLRAWRQMGTLGGTVTVVNTPEQARRVFQAAGLEKLISFG
ncbi:MAG: STAS domain-containing protein [Clostridium sp.]|nr:STAS domain-containing protein [Clostridium sp.]